MLTYFIGLIFGLWVSLFISSFCNCILVRSVRGKFPQAININPAELDGGGNLLGRLETILFFTSFWLGQYIIAGGWLGFKVAAKWASWQHIVKLPESHEETAGNSVGLNDRLRLSSHLLGRFLNGTLYNMLCAGFGGVVGKSIVDNACQIREMVQDFWLWVYFALLVALILTRVYHEWPVKDENSRTINHMHWLAERIETLSARLK